MQSSLGNAKTGFSLRRKEQDMKRSFTLIELLVVIAIIALLMGILIPTVRSARDRARLMVCASNQRQLVFGLSTYAADNDSRLPLSHVERRGSSFLFTWANHINYHSNQPVDSWNNGGAVHYYLGKYLPEVEVFMCPLGPPVDEKKYQALYAGYDDPEVLGRYHGGDADITTTSSYNMFWGGIKSLAVISVGQPRWPTRARFWSAM